MKKVYITLQQLRKLNACSGQVQLFKDMFGERVEVSLANDKAYGHLFDINWLVGKLLNASYLTEYKRVRASDYVEYKRVRATAWPEYERVADTAYAEYESVVATAYAEYRRITSKTFIKLYLAQERLLS
jgi:hypothetical protein